MIRQEKGFTIVELMIATAVFSLVLLLCSFAIVNVGRVYYKGMIINRTQDAARKTADDVARAIQFGSPGENFYRYGSTGDASDPDTIQAHCLGGVRYSYSVLRAVGEGADAWPHVLWKDRIPQGGDCTPLDITQDNPGGHEGVELLGENMRISSFEVAPSGDAWDISVRVAYGDDENAFEPAGDDVERFSICKGAISGGQFCAVSQLKTTVMKRL